MLLLLALAELLGMAVWFTASAVVPALTAAWDLHDAGRAWLAMSVQIGFIAGAFGSALLVGALTLASASPHLLNALAGVDDWKLVPYLAAALAALGGLIAALFVEERRCCGRRKPC